MTVLSYSYVVIMDCAINTPDHGRNVVDGLNETYKRRLKGGMELIGKLESNNTSKIGMIPSDSNMSSLNLQKKVYTL